MAVRSAGLVAGLTAAAALTIALFGYQAAVTVPAALTSGARAGDANLAARAPDAQDALRHPTALPEDSGDGRRVVYALGGKRVWLVGDDGRAARTFAVAPSTVHPAPGTYQVSSRSNSVAGSDGVRIEHVVRYTAVDGVTVGFSAAVDGKAAAADPARKTGGIRMRRADGDAMWTFATVDSKVVVVP
ncbi:hypothetical protein [Streptomyces sp. ODS05-4]|uniref:hypothetical protein n=1 Tax=Streptomyces sp. ODS05-4 TaxID=2944939 RepID=UPI002109B206|nr:hypothetical protein [Streptomyces sp. ODS05-4]